MHIAPNDNQNKPVIDIDDARVPLNYFNIVKLKNGQSFEYQVPRYETCIVPATGSVNIEVKERNSIILVIGLMMFGVASLKALTFRAVRRQR